MSMDADTIIFELRELSHLNQGRDVKLVTFGRASVTAAGDQLFLSPGNNGWWVHVWNVNGSVALFVEGTTRENLDAARKHIEEEHRAR